MSRNVEASVLSTADKKGWSVTRRLLQGAVAGVGAASILLSACASPGEETARQATELEQSTKNSIGQPGKTVSLMPGYLLADDGVQVRLTPGRVNTMNISMVTGNEAGSGPVLLIRPSVVENPHPGDGPKYWAGGEVVGSTDFQWVGLSDETAEHLTYYTLPDQPRAAFCKGVLTGLVDIEVQNSDSLGLIIDAGGYAKTVAVAETKPEYIDGIEARLPTEGYEETPLC
jgi:hypothetical protein